VDSSPAETSTDTALIVVDMLNSYEHEDADALIASVRETVSPMQALIGEAHERAIPIVYVNDNYGDWTATRETLSQRALAGAERSLVEPVLPPDDVAFVTKARHSIFYETPLDYLLRSQGLKRIVLAGQVTEQCILYSALDAYVRHYSIVVPRDAVAHIHEDLAEAALTMMQTNMRAHVARSQAVFGEPPSG
jgi:nicotinamidase-related amidase